MTAFDRVAVIGVGLIGGSFALALKAAGLARSVIGAGRSRENLELALRRGVIDAVAQGPAEAASRSDLVLLATPVAQFPRLFAAIAPVLATHAVVTDAGSTKLDVVEAARGALGERFTQFVPAHPIAGAEHSGAAAAAADLFRGKRVVLTPLAETSPRSLARVEEAWQACGARLFRMAPQDHDAVFAAVSHLPHLLAYALVHDLAERSNAAQLFGYAAGGFRDFTRIASSHPEMWRDICLANRAALLAELDRYAAQLAALRPMIERGDGAALERVFAAARGARERWLQGDYEP
jgi:prephenate dehydrogenase